MALFEGLRNFFGGGQGAQQAPAARVTPISEMNALQKFGLILQNTADPSTLGKYQQSVIQDQERVRQEQQRQALEQYAGSDAVPANMRAIFQAAPELLPQWALQQNDPLRRIQMAQAQASLENAQTERQRQSALAELFRSSGGGMQQMPEGVYGPPQMTQALDPRQMIMQAAQIDPERYGLKALAAMQPERVAPMSPVGKLYEDYRRGLIPESALESASDPATTEKQRQINALIRQGVSRDEAEKIAYGIIKPITDPQSGDTHLVDMSRGTGVPVRYEDIRQPTPTGGDTLDLYGKSTSTGAASGALQLWSDIAGQAGLPIAKQTVENRQALQTQTQDLVRSLMNSPKFNEGERKAIEKEVSISPKIFESPEALRARMRSIDRSLRIRLENYRRDADRNSGLGAKERNDATVKARSIENFLRQLNVPQQGQGAWTPEKANRLQELRAKRERGELQ